MCSAPAVLLSLDNGIARTRKTNGCTRHHDSVVKIPDERYIRTVDPSAFNVQHISFFLNLNLCCCVVRATRRNMSFASFVLQLGDLIDGYNAPRQSESALRSVKKELDRLAESLPLGVLSSLGNHELYNFTKQRWAQEVNRRQKKHKCTWENTASALPAAVVLYLSNFDALNVAIRQNVIVEF